MDGPEPPVPALATLLVFLQLVRLVLQRQRRQQELVAEVVRCLRAGRRAARRRVWRRPRSTVWWTEVVPTFDAATFVENFRMNRATFEYVRDRVAHVMAPDPRAIGPAVDLDRRVAISLYVLSTTTEFRNIGHLFGVHKSTVCKFYRRFVSALISSCLEEWVRLPTNQEALDSAHDTMQRTGFPGIWAALDGTHLPISAPADGYHDYTNRKGWQSLNMQALVNGNGRFLSVTCNNTGNTHDARVLRQSSLWRQMEGGQLPQGTVPFHGEEVPLRIAGDPAYPLSAWLMRGYTGRGALSAQQEHFNARLSHARVPVEHAFGRYKARWRRLLKRSEVDHRIVPQLAFACAILHNIVEERGEPFRAQWLEAAAADAAEQPPGDMDRAPRAEEYRAAAADREHLCEMLWAHRVQR